MGTVQAFSLGTLLVWEVRGALHIDKAEALLLTSLKKLVNPLHRVAKKPFCRGAGRSRLPTLRSCAVEGSRLSGNAQHPMVAAHRRKAEIA